ncbi:MAG: hypothetical protein R3Y10_00080 [Ferrimonas sp.]
MSPAELIACLDQHLQQQLGHQTPAALTHQLAQELYATMLGWQAPELPVAKMLPPLSLAPLALNGSLMATFVLAP